MSRTPKWAIEEAEFERLVQALAMEGVTEAATRAIRWRLDDYVHRRLERLTENRSARSRGKKNSGAKKKASADMINPVEENPGIDPYLDGIMNRDRSDK